MPVITIIGILSVIGQVFMAWVFLRDPSAGLYGNPRMVWFNVIVFLSGLVVYYVAKFIQRSRGVDVDLSFKQVPEE